MAVIAQLKVLLATHGQYYLCVSLVTNDRAERPNNLRELTSIEVPAEQCIDAEAAPVRGIGEPSMRCRSGNHVEHALYA
jgi:hypothetical protein